MAIAALMIVSMPAFTQQTSSQILHGVTIHGTVLSSDGKLVGDAVVRLEQKDSSRIVETRTDAAGVFAFSALRVGSYQLVAEKSELHSRVATVAVPSKGDQEDINLILEDRGLVHPDSTSSPSSLQAMTFADKPNFTVAGVTDWTAVGGHGSDSSLRTSEALASETLMLKSASPKDNATKVVGDANEGKMRAVLASAPDSFEANYQLGEFYLHAGRYRESIPLLQNAHRIDPANHSSEYDLALAYDGGGDFSQSLELVHELLTHQENADLHRLEGELNEKLGNPLAAVHEYEKAVRLDPSEQNYFEWGSELLLHRAVWQAQEVFRKGAEAYPKSARMLTGLGTSLFAGALYDEAALHLCHASDLNPAEPEPYIFMGKIQIAAPNPLTCVEQKLARFVQDQPGNSLANYFYAMAILKRQQQPAEEQVRQQAEALLTKAVTIDTKCADAYLQLGILSASQRDFYKAIDFYKKAIDANPQLDEAYYRLGVAYDRIGEPAKAKEEFRLHDEIQKQQAEIIERQRREVKQFLVVVSGQHAP
jgi:tetratricopeptide (TPR) repeat protein